MTVQRFVAIRKRAEARLVQDQFNAWAKETGLSFVHLSRICAMSVGENYAGVEGGVGDQV
jgi:hypothetical protein